MGVLDALRDADLERGSLLQSKSKTASAYDPSSTVLSLVPRVFWTVAFYAPCALIPLTARVLVVYRDEAVVGFASLLRGMTFGGLQDAAVFFQTVVFARVVLALRDALLPTTNRACYRSALVYTTAALALCVAYLWMTLACVVDLSLLLSYLPRLNRGFVKMYLEFAEQFGSSLHDAVTTHVVVGFVLYVVTMTLWVASVLFNKIQLPFFCLPLVLCRPRRQPATASIAPQHKPPSISSVELSSWLLHRMFTSLSLRTLCVALMVSVSALHATLALGGTGSDTYFLSNAMFSLETESVLASTSHSSANTTTAARVLNFRPCIDRVIGPTESYLPAAGGRYRDAYPLWRKTLAFKGEKRFDVRTHKGRPPTIILLNLESMRSREIGVIGGRDKKARFNQTVSPSFDELSTSGVLFRQHYTPGIQTSRTLMSTLFGVLPSLTVETAVARAATTKFRLHGLPQILKEAFQYTSVFWSAVNLGWEHWRDFLGANGFDTLVDNKAVLTHLSEARRSALTKDDRFSWGVHDSVSFEALENFLESRRVNETHGPPLFLDVYSISSHDPFPAPPNFTATGNYSAFVTKENKAYVDALHYVDHQLGKLITNLRAKRLLDNTIVFIEGDHGNGRSEHGHNPTIVSSRVYEEATHIPLLILADDLLREQDKGLVVDDVTSQTDILATVADMLGIKGFMQHGVGQSLLRKPPSPSRSRPEQVDVATRGVVLENPYDGTTVGVRVGRDLKYVRSGSGKFAVFNLTSDPHEMTPVETGHVDTGFLNASTETQFRFATQVIDMTQFMYETDGFMPPPLQTNTAKQATPRAIKGSEQHPTKNESTRSH